MSSTRRLTTRVVVTASVTVAAAAAAVLVIAGAASAHVTVGSDDASQGGYAVVTFRVPNETDNANTTKLQVFFPRTQPLASVSIQPHPGWSFRVKTTKLAKPISSDDGQVTQAVSEVTWTADSKATAIRPGEFDQFVISAGPLPKSPTMVFKALQTYSDGTIVRWIDPTPAGGPEPEHPAPTLMLTTATVDEAGATTSSGAGGSAGGSGRATAALVVSVVALLIALGAGAVVVLRRPTS